MSNFLNEMYEEHDKLVLILEMPQELRNGSPSILRTILQEYAKMSHGTTAVYISPKDRHDSIVAFDNLIYEKRLSSYPDEETIIQSIENCENTISFLFIEEIDKLFSEIGLYKKRMVRALQRLRQYSSKYGIGIFVTYSNPSFFYQNGQPRVWRDTYPSFCELSLQLPIWEEKLFHYGFFAIPGAPLVKSTQSIHFFLDNYIPWDVFDSFLTESAMITWANHSDTAGGIPWLLSFIYNQKEISLEDKCIWMKVVQKVTYFETAHFQLALHQWLEDMDGILQMLLKDEKFQDYAEKACQDLHEDDHEYMYPITWQNENGFVILNSQGMILEIVGIDNLLLKKLNVI